MWMTIAFARAGAITGHRSYTAVAKANFDVVFSRAWSNDFGGGLWWRVGRHQRREKNVTTNAPAVIAACELYLNLHQASYLAKAERVYAWLRRHLYNPRSGRLYDAVWWTNAHTPHFRVTRFTYNQGSFIGAACLLHAITGRKVYFDDALRALHYTQDNLTTGGILQNDALHANMDRGGFKGIFARWALTFARENHLSTFDAWFRLNATTAWSHRNAAGLMGYDWLVTPRNGPQFSFDCSSGVAMMEYLLPHGTP
jgi:predicted alpha-1,6-mannanase (GH76 family)